MQHRSTKATKRSLVASTIPAILAMLGLVVATGPLSAQEQDEPTDEVAELDETVVEESDDEADEEASESEEESDEVMDQMTVTGTRLPDGDPTALVQSYTAEDIALTGATTLDDFFRTIPQQFNSTNPTTAGIFDNGDQLRGDSGGLYRRTDLATVNLLGLGSGNTLILLNGRRVASYGGSERDIVNILGIPMSAIERVDIQLDGGSAVYGSDAIGGVVNFITKKNYRGITGNLKQEISSSGSDLLTGGATLGVSWGLFGGRGNGTLNLSKSEQEPILNAKLGFNTRDFRDILGPEFDYRVYYTSQPGIVYHWNGSKRFPYPYFNNYYIDGTWDRDPEKLFSYQLPSDHSGLGATVDDFKKGPNNSYDHIEPYDRIEHENGSHRSNQSAILSLNHDVFEGLKVYFDGRYNESWTYRKDALPFMTVAVPASNAYNPFGQPMVVRYAPGVEQDNGLLPTPFQENTEVIEGGTLGIQWNFMGNQTVQFEYTDSESETHQTYFRVPLTRERYAAGTEEYYSRLSSPDPAVAFNLFGNGTAQGSAIRDFLGETGRQIGINRTTTMELLFKGYLWEFRGDEISYVVGTRRSAKRYQTRYRSTTGVSTYEFDYNAIWNGTTEPTIRNESYFFEVWVPLFSEAHAGWWGRSLQLTLKNTQTTDSQWGQDGGGYDFQFETTDVEAWDPETADWGTDTGYNFEYGINEDAPRVQYKQKDDAPTVGIVYYPIDALRVTFNFSRSIDPPLISQLYDSLEASEWQTYDVLDPFDPDGPTLHEIVPYRRTWANVNLKAAVAEITSVRMVWQPSFLEGLKLEAYLVDNNFEGDILQSSALQDYPEALAYDILAVRNERGDLIALNYDYYNSHLNKRRSAEFKLFYRFSTARLGQLETRVTYNRLLDNYWEPIPGLVFDESGKIRAPNRYTTQLQLFWDRNQFSASLFARYIPPYLNDVAHYCSFSQKLNKVGRCAQFSPFDYLDTYIQLPVASNTVVDGTFTYRFSDKLDFRFGALNLFDRGPPLTVRGRFSTATPYDPIRWNARARVLSLGVNYKM